MLVATKRAILTLTNILYFCLANEREGIRMNGAYICNEVSSIGIHSREKRENSLYCRIVCL